jgi:hypothetical protein
LTLHSALLASPISRVILLTASFGTHAIDCILSQLQQQLF